MQQDVHSPRWFLGKNKQKLGPFSMQQLRQMVSEGQLTSSDMLLEVGTAKWRPASEIDGIFPVAALVQEPATTATRGPRSTGNLGGNKAKGHKRISAKWLILLAPCLFLLPCGLGMVCYLAGGKGNVSKTVAEELIVTRKDSRFAPGHEGNWILRRYYVTLADQKGTEKTLLVNDSFMAAHFRSEDLFDNIEVGRTYQVFFKGGKHHFAGLAPKCRSSNIHEEIKLMQQSMEAEMQVFDLLWDGDPRERDRIIRLMNQEKANP